MSKKRMCPKCGRELALSEFYVSKKRCSSWCKECVRAQKREWYNRNRKKPDDIRQGKGGRVVEHKGFAVSLYWGEQKLRDFRRLFPVTLNEELAVIFGCSVRTVIRKARELGLEKDPDWFHGIKMDRCGMMHFHNKIYGIKFDREQLLRAGEPYRFKKGEKSRLTPEQHSERMKKAWETRKNNNIKH